MASTIAAATMSASVTKGAVAGPLRRDRMPRQHILQGLSGRSFCSGGLAGASLFRINKAHMAGGSCPSGFRAEGVHKSTRNTRLAAVKAEAGTDSEPEKAPFGYTRKDVILIGVGILFLGVALKSGLEFAGLDPLQAGNVVQIVMVLGLMVGWTITYVFRVGNKEMTYVKQLKDYEDAVMQKRLEELPEAELEAMLAEIEEEKLRIKERREKKKAQG